MPTLQEAKFNAKIHSACPVEAALKRLAPGMARAAAETAGAFLNVPSAVATAYEAPRISELGSVHCSQKNIGEKYEMICNLASNMSEWNRLFPADVPEQIKTDAFCELANCICGSMMAEPGFADEFGFLIPCVPCEGSSRPEAGSRCMRGALSLDGTWIHFSIAVQEAAAAQSNRLTAVA